MAAIGSRWTGDFGTLEILTDAADQRSYWLNDERISRDEAQRIIDEWWRGRAPTV